jgi:hypothetical protein
MVLKRTNTTRKRAVTLYLPTEEMKENWYSIAKEKKGMSVSNFIIEIVEDYFQKNREFNTKEDISAELERLKKQNKRLQHENVELQKKVDMLNLLTERYEKQLMDYRNKTFIENGKFEGVRKYQHSLIELFKRKHSVKEDELIDLLHIDPSDGNTLKAISKQIEYLEDYGLIQPIRRGWLWKG